MQYAPEHVIAAIEQFGGTITLAYYDVHSLFALVDPKKFFEKGECIGSIKVNLSSKRLVLKQVFFLGEPIPKRYLPPENAVALYTDPKKRGYLADPQAVAIERGILAQKYGYNLLETVCPFRKDPLQLFLGLQPGWIVNLKDKVILKPKDPEILKYYTSEKL